MVKFDKTCQCCANFLAKGKQNIKNLPNAVCSNLQPEWTAFLSYQIWTHRMEEK